MSDMVTEMTILNAHGDLVTYSEAKDPVAFSAACINLGLLGIIYTITLKVEIMDTRLRVKDSYPTLKSVLDGADAGTRLKARVLKNYSTEIFYWPFKHSMKPDQNDAIWIKECEQTTEPVEAGKDRPPMIDHTFFSTFQVGEQVLEIPDALHFSFGDETSTALAACAAIKADGDFKNVVQMFKDLVEKVTAQRMCVG